MTRGRFSLPKDPEKRKLKLSVIEAIYTEPGLKIADVAKQAGVSESTLRRWLTDISEITAGKIIEACEKTREQAV